MGIFALLGLGLLQPAGIHRVIHQVCAGTKPYDATIANTCSLLSLPDYALSIGLTHQQGSVINALFSLGQGLSRPVLGFYSDAAGRLNIAGFLTLLCGLFCLTLCIFAKSYCVLIFFAIIVGTVAGVYWRTVAPVTAEVVNLKDLPSALSLTWLILVLPTTCKLRYPKNRHILCSTNLSVS